MFTLQVKQRRTLQQQRQRGTAAAASHKAYSEPGVKKRGSQINPKITPRKREGEKKQHKTAKTCSAPVLLLAPVCAENTLASNCLCTTFFTGWADHLNLLPFQLSASSHNSLMRRAPFSSLTSPSSCHMHWSQTLMLHIPVSDFTS